MTNKHETSYTNRIKNNFFTLTVPHYIRGTKEAANTENEARDLEDRKRQKDNLLVTRGTTSANYKKAQADLDDFQLKVQEYRQANNIKNPSSTDLALIASVKRSVSSVRLTGPAHGVSDIERQIAGHANMLIKRRDEAMKAWNDAGKVFWWLRI